jgi:hypothetical protein
MRKTDKKMQLKKEKKQRKKQKKRTVDGWKSKNHGDIVLY